MFFFLKLKGELALTYESYADGILIVILIESIGVLDFFFFFVSICLSMCQVVCVSVHLFTVNLKFLKTHNY